MPGDAATEEIAADLRDPDTGVDGSRGDTAVDSRRDAAARDIRVDSGSDASLDLSDASGEQEDLSPDLDPPMIAASWQSIPAGVFQMGSPAGERCRYADEAQHQVTLSRGFEIQHTSVTQAQFELRMGYNPSYYSATGGGDACGKNCPVETVSWHEAAAYCNTLSTGAGVETCYTCTGLQHRVECSAKSAYSGQAFCSCPGYRLPTEAEWEYAHRAGSQSAYYNGTQGSLGCAECTDIDSDVDAIGWYCANSGAQDGPFGVSGGSPHPVGLKVKNAWGLSDMAGNLWQWCQDWYGDYPASDAVDPTGSSTGTHRVVRGGSFRDEPAMLRAAARGLREMSRRSGFVGFRCVRTK